MRPTQTERIPKAIKLAVIVMIIVCVAAAWLTYWAIDKRSEATEPPASDNNAFCSDGRCYRSNGLYIGPDPLVLQSTAPQAKVPEFVPPKS